MNYLIASKNLSGNNRVEEHASGKSNHVVNDKMKIVFVT